MFLFVQGFLKSYKNKARFEPEGHVLVRKVKKFEQP